MPATWMHLRYVQFGSFWERAIFQHKEIVLKDSAESYDFWVGDRDRELIVLEEPVTPEEAVEIAKYPFMSWLGFPVSVPWLVVRWYGRRIYFVDNSEYADFAHFRWMSRLADRCPVCGESLKRQLRYCFTQGAGLPYEVFFCSRECLSHFMHNIGVYREILPELKQIPKW